MRTADFISASQKIHDNLYNYTKTIYKSKKSKVEIICNKCTKPFWQRADSHLRGANCPYCKAQRTADKLRSTTEIYIQKVKKIHHNSFDYANLEYFGCESDVTFVCKKCNNTITMRASAHLDGAGCKHCFHSRLSQEKLFTKQEFIQKAVSIHGNSYNYELSEYKGCAAKLKIFCNSCQRCFSQHAGNHLTGSGCPTCVKTATDVKKTKSSIVVQDELIALHGKEFDYSSINYKNCSTKITVKCKKCGKEHPTYIHNHRVHAACPYCQVSSGQRQIVDYIQGLLNTEIKINDREIIHPLELDIYLPQQKLAIEYHGLYFHSYNHNPTKYEIHKHQDKALKTHSTNIKLLQFWSSEWESQRTIVESIIKHHLQLSNRIYARSCKIVDINEPFFDKNHIQGERPSSVRIGLEYNGTIVAGMSFAKHPTYQWEIMRFANILNHTVVGGASKLLTYFLRTHRPQKLLSYANMRFSTGGVYEALGFVNKGMTKPNYGYTNGRTTILSRQKFQKHKLHKIIQNYQPELSESENCFNNGLRRIWDSGHIRYVLTL